MTAFTDDLDNDVEVLAEHHDVTPVQVAKAAFAQVPEHVRLPLLRELLSVQPTPVPEDPEVLSSHTGLPQKLRGAIHELTRRYPVNLIVDAAMLEVDDEIVREAIARAFLPKEPEARKHEVRRYELIDAENGDVLWSGAEPFQPMKFDYVAADGSVRGYQREGHMAFEFGPGVKGITGQTCYRSLESLAEESEGKQKTLREKLDLIKEEKAAAKVGLYTVVDVASEEELGLVDALEHRIRVLDGKTGQSISYEHMRTEPEYDFREGEAVKPRKLALYRKVTAE
jgi:hypothetical protein